VDQRSLADADVFAAMQAMAKRTARSLSGIYYEKPPAGAIAAGLYVAVAKFIVDEKKRQTEHSQSSH